MESDYSESECESYDSDRELQIAFKAGLLQPGLNAAVKVQERTFTNDKAGLRAALQELQEGKKDLPWIERLDLTVDPVDAPKPLADQLNEEAQTDDGVHDDFKREMKFYRLAQAAVLEGIPRLQSLGVPTKRPEDYLAEMTKSDVQMKRIREKLMSKQVSMERSAKAKKMRELRKYGKKVQQEVLLKRQQEKKEMMSQVKKFRKGQADKIDFLEEMKEKGSKKSKQKDAVSRNKKREHKNEKFGYGGQKKRSKSNTAQSAGSFKEYDNKKHGKVPSKYINKNKKNASRGNKGKGGMTKKRPGKERRKANKARNN